MESKTRPVQQGVTVFIYGLTDPRDGVVRYVGQSIAPARRFKTHLSSLGRPTECSISEWLEELTELGLTPQICILEACESAKANDREYFWIKWFGGQERRLCNQRVKRLLKSDRGRGRPPKPKDDLYVFKTVRFPPELWAELEATAPAGRRSAVIQEGLRRELRRLKRQAAAEKPISQPYTQPAEEQLDGR